MCRWHTWLIQDPFTLTFFSRRFGPMEQCSKPLFVDDSMGLCYPKEVGTITIHFQKSVLTQCKGTVKELGRRASPCFKKHRSVLSQPLLVEKCDWHLPVAGIYIYFKICTHMHTRTHTHTYIYIYIQARICICICIYVYMYKYKCICICIYILYLFSCLYVYIYVYYVYVYVYMYICICVYAYAYVYVYVHEYCICICTFTYTNIYIYM
jgi:hypothetical protein